jgi:hypothetical protein
LLPLEEQAPGVREDSAQLPTKDNNNKSPEMPIGETSF